MGCIGWCFFRAASGPRRAGQSEVANGWALYGPRVSLIETARSRRGGRNRIFRVELRFSSNDRAYEADGSTKGWIGMQPTEKKAAKNPLTRPRQPHQRSNNISTN